MSPELLEALRPFGVAGLALVVFYLIFRQLGFNPINIQSKHGVWVALAFIVVAGIVVTLTIIIFPNDPVDGPKGSWVQEESKLGTLLRLNSSDQDRQFLLKFATPELDDFVVDRNIDASDDQELVSLICNIYDCISCVESTSSDSMKIVTMTLNLQKTEQVSRGLMCN